MSYYAGCGILQPISDAIGLPVDQINFVACHVVSLLLAIPFRVFLPPTVSNAPRRHVFEFLVGLSMALFCFGHTVLHLLVLSLVSYAAIVRDWTPAPSLLKPHVVVFVFSMAYLCLNHVYRQIYDYGSYTLDVTGPMMLMVLKISGLAFSFNDSRRPRSELSADQLNQMVVEKPSYLEFLSYMFYFHGMMCGPPCTYADYKRFIEGENFSGGLECVPSPLRPFLKKLANSLICAVVMLTVATRFDPHLVVDPDWIVQTSAPKRALMAIVHLGLVRARYYFAYYFSEAINNLAGLGYVESSDGSTSWDLVKNVDVTKVELSLSLKETVESWNKTSTVWLRRCVYDRLPPSYNLPVTYAVSALWHGFYPGYYFTFGTAALFVAASRKVRRNVRPHFQGSPLMSKIYDVITFLATRLVTPYCFGPFVLLNVRDTLRLYQSMYYLFHLAALLIVLLLPKGRSSGSPSTKSSTSANSTAANGNSRLENSLEEMKTR